MSRAATSRLKVNPQLGIRPSLEFRRIHELEIDPTYQRSIEAGPSQSLIRRIAMYWDWSLCQPLAVAKRADGRLMVVDGQHRLEAARLRADIYDLPCVVTAYASAGDEAAAFVALNQQRRPLSRLDLFKAALAAGDDEARQILGAVTAAGLSLAPHTNPTAWKPGMIANIAGLYESWRGAGARPTSLALSVLAKAFSGQVLAYAGTIFPGIVGFIRDELNVEGKVDTDRLAAVIGSMSQKQWVAEITLEAAATESGRRQVAKNVVSRFYRRPPEGAVAALPIVDPVVRTFCEQCDQRVTGAQINACTSRWCKAKAVAA